MEVAVIIALRHTDSPEIALRSLARQTFRDFATIIVYDQGRGAPWARNQAAALGWTPDVLVSDGDIDWHPKALENLRKTLAADPSASFAYGRYRFGRAEFGDPWDVEKLRLGNYISGASLFRRCAMPPWDESLKRLQDWDLWLDMISKGRHGAFCDRLIFTTGIRSGDISGRNKRGLIAARSVIAQKWGLAL